MRCQVGRLIGTDAAAVSTRSTGGQWKGLRRVEPLTSTELIRAGVSQRLLTSLALRRAAGGGVAKFGDHYFDSGRPTPSYLTGVFDELVSTRLLALAEENPGRVQRVSLTAAGQREYEQLSATPR